MVEIKLPEILTEEFISLIPEQRMKINSLMDAGVILCYTLNQERSRLWTVIVAKSDLAVMDILAQFPMISYMKPEINELTFHHQSSLVMPSISLN
jgi:muconolactone delta-isomerase